MRFFSIWNALSVSLYADDAEMHSSSKDIDLAEHNVNKDLRSIQHWFCRNGLIYNTKKMKNHGYCIPESNQNHQGH